MIISADTSENVICILVGEEKTISDIVFSLRRAILGQRDRCLHLRCLSSRDRRRAISTVARIIDSILSHVHVVIVVVKGKFKRHKEKLIRLFLRLAAEYSVRV